MMSIMKKAGLFAAAALTANTAFAQLPTKVVSGNITANRTFVNDTIYLLDGFVYVKNSATLTIEAGTVVQGYIDPVVGNTKGTLIITRTGMIDAQGTECEPIVFTSARPAGQRGTGDWGGVILLGEAPVNRGTLQASGFYTDIIEGGLTGDVADRTFGGNNALDNSGTMTYCRIEYAGIAFTPNNEINSLTMGGVGAGTTINHIFVSYAGDDAFEWFGGATTHTHLVAYNTVDDNFDGDEGWQGGVQFAIIYQDANIADISRSEGWEFDNDASNPNRLPRTTAIFSNVTVVGPKVNGTPNALHQSVARIRRGSYVSIHNSVFVDHIDGIFIDGNDSYAGWFGGAYGLTNNLMAGMTNNFKASGSHSSTDISNLWNAGNNSVLANATAIGLQAGYSNVTAPVLMPAPGSPAASGASFAFPLGNNFNQVAFRGAMGTEDWTANWGNWNPQATDYTNGIGGGVSGLASSAAGNYSMNFSWNAAAGATNGYRVEWRAQGSGTWTNGVPVNGTSRTIGNLAPGNYEWRVVFNNPARSNSSCIESFSIACATDINFSVNKFDAPEMGRLGFITVLGITGGKSLYNISIEDAMGNVTSVSNRRSNSFRNLAGGAYTVSVTDAFDCAAADQNVTLAALDTAYVPVMTGAPNASPNGFRPTWRTVNQPGVSSYQVRVRNETDNQLVSLITGVTDTFRVVNNLTPGKTYRFNVRSRYNPGSGVVNSAYSAGQNRVLGAGGNKNEGVDVAGSEFNVYPNPANDVVFVDASADASVELMDMNGRVLNAAAGSTSFDISNLSSGVYMVRVIAGEEVNVVKVVKQ